MSQAELQGTISAQMHKDAAYEGAITLKRKWRHLTGLFAFHNDNLTSEPPSDEELQKIAGDFIIKRSATLTFADGHTREVSLSEIDEKISTLPQENKAHLGDMQSMQNLVPQTQVMERVSAVVAQEAESHDGIGSFFKGIMHIFQTQGAGAGFGMLFKGLVAFFTGEKVPELQQAIAEAVAPDVKNGVTARLETLAASDPEAAKFLHTVGSNGKTVISTIGDKAHDKTYEKLGITPPTPSVVASAPASDSGTPVTTVSTQQPAPTAPSLADVKPEDPKLPSRDELKAEVLKKVRTAVPHNNGQLAKHTDTGKDITSLGEYIGNEMVKIKQSGMGSNYLGFIKGVTEESLRASGWQIAGTIQETVAQRVTDPNFVDPITGKKLAELDQAQMSNALTTQIKDALLANEKSFNLPSGYGLSDKSDDDRTYLNRYTDDIRAAVADNYQDLKRVANLSTQSAVQVAAAQQPDASAQARAAGIGGGHDATETQVPITQVAAAAQPQARR